MPLGVCIFLTGNTFHQAKLTTKTSVRGALKEMDEVERSRRKVISVRHVSGEGADVLQKLLWVSNELGSPVESLLTDVLEEGIKIGMKMREK